VLVGETVFGPFDISQQTDGCPLKEVTPVPPVYTAGTCAGPGSVVATDTDEYTWAVTGPDSARVATATAEPGFVLVGETVFGPYDITPPAEDGCTVVGLELRKRVVDVGDPVPNVPADWELSADGVGGNDVVGRGPVVGRDDLVPGSFTLSEVGVAAGTESYVAGGWDCVGGGPWSGIG
jgi:hypothetical protein